MMYAPGLSLSRPIAQAIEDLSNHLGSTDFGQLFDEFNGFVVGDATVMSCTITRHA